MRHPEKWTNPNGEKPAAEHHLSYALFTTNEDVGYILAAHTPERERLATADHLIDRLVLPLDERQFLRDHLHGQAPRFILSKLGLGILSKRYDLHAGIGIYWHIHGSPEAAARLVNYGAIGAEGPTTFSVSDRVREKGSRVLTRDMPTFDALSDAWGVVRAFEHGLLPVNEDSLLDVDDLRRVIERFADLAGCRVRVETAGGGSLVRRVKCYRPLMLEAMLLYLVTEVGEYAVDRQAVFEISSLGRLDCENLSLTVRYSLDTRTMKPARREALATARDYVAIVAEVGGLDMYFTQPPTVEEQMAPIPGHRCRRSPICEQVLVLDWISDPSLLPSSDFKAHVKLRYEDRQ